MSKEDYMEVADSFWMEDSYDFDHCDAYEKLIFFLSRLLT